MPTSNFFKTLQEENKSSPLMSDAFFANAILHRANELFPLQMRILDCMVTYQRNSLTCSINGKSINVLLALRMLIEPVARTYLRLLSFDSGIRRFAFARLKLIYKARRDLKEEEKNKRPLDCPQLPFLSFDSETDLLELSKRLNGNVTATLEALVKNNWNVESFKEATSPTSTIAAPQEQINTQDSEIKE